MLIGFYVLLDDWIEPKPSNSNMTYDVIPSVLINRLLPLFLFPMLSLSPLSLTPSSRQEDEVKVCWKWMFLSDT